MDEACAEHLHVHAHGIHPADSLADIAHTTKHELGARPDALAHLVGDTGIGRQFGEDIVLRCELVHLRHDHVGVKIDHSPAGMA